MSKQSSRKWILEIIFLLLFTAGTYLVLVNRLDYYRDDWYYILDGHFAGPRVFHEMFAIDRPMRGYVFEALFNAFGTNPLPYHVTAALWRGLSGIAALWLFRLLWPQKRQATFTAALLFTLYPGYLWWVAGVEYQPMILSVLFQIISIALTLQAILATQRGWKIAAIIGAILTGWVYIGLVDYAIGMEAFRLLCVYLLVSRKDPGISFIKQSVQTLRVWAVNALIPLGYLFWRIFFFNNVRSDTDISLQLGRLLRDPFNTSALWFGRWLQSSFNVSLTAWAAPFYRNAFSLTPMEVLAGLLLTICIILVLLAVYRQGFSEEKTEPQDHETEKWTIEAIVIGALGVFLGVIPVILANRYVVFEAYSHYALPASLAGVVMVIGIVYLIRSQPVRTGLIALLVGFAVMTHYANAARAAYEEKIIRDFWWQVSWRIPGLRPGTTLAVNYPTINYGEDIDIVWGPANLIYKQDQKKSTPVEYPVFAFSLLNDKVGGVWAGRENEETRYRSHISLTNYDQVLVMSQPGLSSCVHVMDSRWPRTSLGDHPAIILTAPYSDIQNIDDSSKPVTPPFVPFGAEPEHGWCYFYQQAELAVQQEDWQEVITLAETAAQSNLEPKDRVEWLPFLQGYAQVGEVESFLTIVNKIEDDPYLRQLACQAISTMSAQGLIPSQPIQSSTQDRLCIDSEP